MHATDWVLQDPERLAPFNLPPALWSRITGSWADRRNQMITGRFDFAVVGGEIKVFEYNCDSASCHMEAGKLQGRWADHFGVVESHDPGLPLVGDRYVQLCTFTVGGLHAGTCTRIDTSPVITCDSEIWPLRVVGDALFTR